MTMVYAHALERLALRNEDIVVMTAENRAHIKPLASSLGRRFIDVGICEQTLVGAAAGLALRGRTPVVHALAAFLTMRAFEFIRTNVGIAGLPVKLVGYVPGLLSGANGPTHQALEDIALMRGIPGMHVFCPSDERELLEALPSILAHPSPCYVRFVDTPALERSRPSFAYGQASRLAPGGDVALVTYGFLVAEVLRARDLLSDIGIECGVLHVPMPKPLDEAAILEVARASRRVVVIEDHFASTGLGSMVCALLARHGVLRPVAQIALDERWHVPGLLADVLEHEGFSARRIAGRVASLLAAEAMA